MRTLKALLWKDSLRFWPLAGLWLLVLAGWAIPACSPEWREPSGRDRVMETLITGLPLLMAALLVMADGPARRRLDVHARPVPRWSVAVAKALGMLWMIVLPLMLAHAAVFWANAVSPALAAQALAEILALVTARCVLAGCMAAMCSGIADWVRGLTVVIAATVVAVILVRLGLTVQHYLAGLLLLGVGPMVSAPDLRQLVPMAVMAVILVVWPGVCRRMGWIGGWTRWSGAALLAGGICWLLSPGALKVQSWTDPAASGGLVTISGPRDAEGNAEPSWTPLDQALAEKTVREAVLIPSSLSWPKAPDFMVNTVMVGQKPEGVPGGVFVVWRCQGEPLISGGLKNAGWTRSGFSSGVEMSEPARRRNAEAAMKTLITQEMAASGEKPVIRQAEADGWAELGSVTSVNGQPLEGEVSMEATLAGQVWRWRLVRRLAFGDAAEWRDGNGAWRMEYSDGLPGVKFQRRKLSLAWPSTADQSRQSSLFWNKAVRGVGQGSGQDLNPSGFYTGRLSTGWWEKWDGAEYLSWEKQGSELFLLQLEYLGMAERQWSSGPVRFEKSTRRETSRNFAWPDFGSGKPADYLADLQRSRPDPAGCGEEEVRRYLWKACRGLAFAGVTGNSDIEAAAQQLAPLAARFRETFRQGLSRISCRQNTLLLSALRQGLPPEEYKAMNLQER